MNARSIALAITFAAIAIALNVVKIPTIYWPGWSYHFNEIPIVIAFMLFGPKIGILVGVIHLTGQELLFPTGPAGIVAYPMGFIALLLMLSGVYLANWFISRRTSPDKPFSEKRRSVYLTAFSTASRGAIMPFLTYGVMYHVLLPLVLGINVPETNVMALVPSFILYNVTVPLYTIPIAYFTATEVNKSLRIE